MNVEGTEGVVGNGSDRHRRGFARATRWSRSRIDGELAQFNTKDPQYAQKMMGLVAERACEGERRTGQSAGEEDDAGGDPGIRAEEQAACGANQGCLMKLAYEAQDLMANMDTGAAPTATSNPGAYTGDEPPRYLNYFGFDKCGASGSVLRRSHHPGHLR